MNGEISEQRLKDILTCVMARPGMSPRTVFAKRSDGEIIHISRAALGTQGLECPGCGLELIAKPGHGGRVPHFAHKSSAECRHAGETDLHLMAKEAIEDAGGLMLPSFDVRTARGTRTPLPSRWFEFERVELEKTQDGFKPDVVGYGRHPDTGETHRLMIEVFVTHRVGEDKLARIAASGESAIEIDLSKIDRDLNGPAFIEEILRAAPRRWIYHRAEDDLRQKVLLQEAQEQAKRESRKAYAIAKAAQDDEERERARNRPPRLAGEVETKWAAEERHRWDLLDMEGLFIRPADDGVFDIFPDVWRAWVLSAIAPWRKKSHSLPGQEGLSGFAQALGKEIRKKGWVKAPFAGSLRKFVGRRYQPWDPVAEAIEPFLVKGLRAYGFGSSHTIETVSLSYVASTLDTTWKERQRWAREVFALRDKVAPYGVELWLKGVRVAPDTGTDEVIAAHRSVSNFNHFAIFDMAREIETGIVRLGVRNGPVDYAHEGIELRRAGDTGPECTQRALKHIEGRHAEVWGRELEDWARGEARRILSVFRDLSAQGLLPDAEVTKAGVDFLFDEAALVSRICRPLSFTNKEPLPAARAEGAKVISRFDRFAEQVSYLGKLASLHDATHWRETILSTGLSRALTKECRDGFMRAMSADMRSVIEESIADLRRVSERWGYGKDFPERAITSRPMWSDARLVDLLFCGDIKLLRRAMNEIKTRRQPPSWVTAPEKHQAPRSAE